MAARPTAGARRGHHPGVQLSRLGWLNGSVKAMRRVNMHEAKTHLSRLVEEAAAGSPFVICKGGRPMVRVIPLDDGAQDVPKRRLGLLAGECEVPDDFDRLGADAIADLFEGR